MKLIMENWRKYLEEQPEEIALGNLVMVKQTDFPDIDFAAFGTVLEVNDEPAYVEGQYYQGDTDPRHKWFGVCDFKKEFELRQLKVVEEIPSSWLGHPENADEDGSYEVVPGKTTKTLTTEAISLDISVGDVILGGKYKNKRMVVKDIGEDELGQPTINGKSILKFRIEKHLPDEKKSKKTKDAEKAAEESGE